LDNSEDLLVFYLEMSLCLCEVFERDYGLLNGLVDLNRDVLMKLIKIIDMGKISYVWSKRPVFRWSRFPGFSFFS
jgi:hypothetical protein